MNVLVLGGTGIISVGIVRDLLARGASVTLYNRGNRPELVPRGARVWAGDRSNVVEFLNAFDKSRFDAVIDMICFTAADAESSVAAFGGRCEHFMFCSTVCTYGGEISERVFIDESFPQKPVSAYGRGKLVCEQIFARAMDRGLFRVSIVRPTHTYGPGGPLVDQLEIDGTSWDRMVRGLPVLCAGDGLGLWQPTHRDDSGRFFAYAALNPKCYGQAYNATGQETLTWRDYYRKAASALGVRAEVIFVPAAWLVESMPARFRFLNEVTRFHGAYCSAKARADVPEFRTTIPFEVGARETFADIRRRGSWRDSSADTAYERLVCRALEFGLAPTSA